MKHQAPLFFLLVFAVSCLFVGQRLHAQTIGTSARITGMGNSSVALVRGLDALNANPAQIVPDDGVVVSFGVLPFSAQASMDFLSYELYNRYFTGTLGSNRKRTPTFLTEEDKQTILSSFSCEVGNFTHDIRYTLFNAMVSTKLFTVAFGITERTGSNVSLPQSYADFLLFGNPPGKTFDFSATRVSSAWTRDYSLTVGREILSLHGMKLLAGISLKKVHGMAYFEVERFNSHVTTDADTYEIHGQADLVARYAGTKDWLTENNSFHYQLFPTPVGSGWGLDIGANLRVNRMFSASLSLLDLGAIRWSDDTKQISASETFSIDDVSSDRQNEEIKQRLNGSERPISGFTTPLPSAMVVAGVLTIPNVPKRHSDWHFTFAWRQGFNSIAGNSTQPQFGLGTEIELLYNVAFRFGINAGGIRPVTFGAGIGFIADNFKLDIGTLDITPHLTERFSAVAVGISSHWDI
jgi:hypothetical protein